MTNFWRGPEMASYHKKETHNSKLPKLKKKNPCRATKSIYFTLKLIAVEQNR